MANEPTMPGPVLNDAARPFDLNQLAPLIGGAGNPQNGSAFLRGWQRAQQEIEAKKLREQQMGVIAGMIDTVVRNAEKPDVFRTIARDVEQLCSAFPLYPELDRS